jgi:dihydrofolate reductase
VSVRVDLNLSLDGIAVPSDLTTGNPMGQDWGRIVAAYAATRTFRERVFHDASGAGTTGVDERYAAEYFDGIGAEIMGAGMFGLHTYPDDPDWRGWWGDEPPFGYPVLVLTHQERAPLEFANGTRFEFLAADTASALARARAVASGGDIRVGGGAEIVRAFLADGLVDRLHVAMTPIVLGRGVRLWDELRMLAPDFAVTSEIAESGVLHVTFSR